MEYTKGQIVRSLAGHDKGDFQVVLSVDGKYVTLCDGKRRSLEKPKKKKIIHTGPTGRVLSEESLGTNRKIREALRNYNA